MRLAPLLPLALSLALSLPPAAASAQPTDTTEISVDPLFTSRDAVLAGGFVLATIAMYPVDRYAARHLQTPSRQENRLVRKAAKAFEFMGTPGSVIIGGSLYVIGRVGGNERMADLGLHGTEAVFVSLGTVGLLKGLAGRGRPLLDVGNPGDFQLGRGFRKDDNYRAFPSGHTAMGFAAAAAVTAETTNWWPKSTIYIAPLMYGGAALIGASRMYNNKHWASDVVMGAAIGTFAGLKVVRYHHSHPGNRVDRVLLGARVTPTGDGGALVSLILK